MWGSKKVLLGAAGITLGALSVGAVTASAQTIPDDGFYKGKQVQFLTYSASGGSSDFFVRLLARYWPDHIPGKPTMIAQNMPGGGGIRMSNYLYKLAPKDGSTIGALNQTLGLEQILGDGVEYDTSKFNWLGRVLATSGLVMIYHTAPATTIEGLREKEVIFAAPGKASQAYMTPTLMRTLLGFKTRVVVGYKGSAEIYLAMERGEVDGRCGGQMSNIKALRPEWLTEHKIVAPIVIALKRHPDFPDTPTVMEFAKDDATRKTLELMTVSQGLDRPVLMPPNVPAERVQEIRDAFKATVTDPEFVAEIKKRNMGLDPVFGEEMTETLKQAFASPPDVIEAARNALGGR